MQSPHYFEFFSQAKISSGSKALEHIPTELDGFDARKPLVITAKRATQAGFGKTLVSAFGESNVIIGALFDDAPDYAPIGLIRDLAGLFRDRGCDSIIALGGGAAADIAKGVNILVSERTDDLLQFAGTDTLRNPLKPFVMIPTAVSNGSETSNRATIERRAFVSDFLFPDVITIDPRIVKPRCGDDIAGTAATALVHSVEACITAPGNSVNEAYAQAAIQFITENLRKTLRCNCNKKRNVALANAAAMGGIAFSNAPMGYAHALGTAVADETGLPAGLCMGVIFPYALQHYQQKGAIAPGLLFSVAGIDVFCSTPDRERADRAVSLLLELMSDLRKYLPATLAELHVPRYQLDSAVRAAVAMSGKALAAAECERIIMHAFTGAPQGAGKSK
ncbi:MAG TPA: iron-containing alcohol dehydrogenase [Spirochaetota bacterium]|nr:iron-containing alcohol dehydrogenase [Spirochaetota bacterium]HNT09757.1 iron-containing alcohol dehydrogenase [Spirochaetota bacterium]